MSPNCNEPHQPVRAILNQIIHRNQNDRDLVDTASILMDTRGTGQRVGSESEIASVLNLALQRHPETRLVLDGLDECTEPLVFLQKLYAICGNTDCKGSLV